MKGIHLHNTYKFIIIGFLLLSFHGLNAQGFKAGIQLGITGTQVTGDRLSGYNKAGLFGGSFVNIPVGKLGDAQLEINFIQKGSRKNAKPSDGIYTSFLLRLNYIEVPVMYRFDIWKQLKIEAGGQFAYLINSRQFDENGEFYEVPGVPDFNKYDISVLAGLNYKINDNWGFSFRYSYSVLAIRPKPFNNNGLNYDGGQYNDVLCTTFQYYF
mgnify:CR=1 FL=1